MTSEIKSEKSIAEWRSLTQTFGKECKKAQNIPFINVLIKTRDGFSLTCRVFNHLNGAECPIFIFYPGCAFIFDFFEVNCSIASRIAEKVGIKVAVVQFRLAPEVSIQTCFDDCYDAAKELSLTAKKVMIGGWCSGATIATHVSKEAIQKNEFKVSHQILLGGSFDLTHSFHAYDEQEAQDPTVTRKLVAYLAERFYSMNSSKNPLYSPYWEDNIKAPPTTILCGEFDALRNDSEAYYEKLKLFQINVDKIILKGQSHNEIVMNKHGDPVHEFVRVIQQN